MNNEDKEKCVNLEDLASFLVAPAGEAIDEYECEHDCEIFGSWMHLDYINDNREAIVKAVFKELKAIRLERDRIMRAAVDSLDRRDS